ncbi:hypothetical protein [Streptomyces yaizuensis]|uniref:Uncharacterized protein n=1 Tax=Streptomyces yaizuensis TaxID=2989713 RepID=A0ABQ5PAD9_9ACTN|nr:hypothetical protein [Streptomyces sp. YSPA8]GLF99541.1 hypothetical protein SYYSPA8_34610 [Streptomyces sp. YSPA8]
MSPQQHRPEAAEREELARLVPVPADRDLPGNRHRLFKHYLMNEVQRDLRDLHPDPAQESARRTRDRRKRLIWRVAVPAAALAAAGGTAAAVMAGGTAPAAAPLTVQCAATLSTEIRDSFATAVRSGESPEQACAKAWPDLVENLRSHPETADRAARWTPAPPDHLVGCTSRNGDRAVIVYPRPTGLTAERACARVGQVRPDDGPVYAGATAEQVRKLAELVDDRIGDRIGDGTDGGTGGGSIGPGGACAPYSVMRTAVERSLDELGMSRWRIDNQHTGGDGGTVWYDIREATGTVVLRDGTRLCTAG